MGLRKIVELQDAVFQDCFQQWPMLLALRERKTMKRKWHFALRSNLCNYIQNCVSVSPQAQKPGIHSSLGEVWWSLWVFVGFFFLNLGILTFSPTNCNVADMVNIFKYWIQQLYYFLSLLILWSAFRFNLFWFLCFNYGYRVLGKAWRI